MMIMCIKSGFHIIQSSIIILINSNNKIVINNIHKFSTLYFILIL